jgi:cellulose synthase (UDP-forming)
MATCVALACSSASVQKPADEKVRRLDSLSALWSFYKFHYIDAGRVVSLDEDRITTSEGQGYAMLRAVWAGDPQTFAEVWEWTRRNLAVRGDHLFAWKWKKRVLDRNSATDADTDIALALLLAARRFSQPDYEREAREILADIWEKEVLQAGEWAYPTAGDWTMRERYPVIHVAYLAPYAYAEFAQIDDAHPWDRLIEGSYQLLDWLYFEKRVAFPPEIVYADAKTGGLRLEHPRTKAVGRFSYDAFPIFWRVALDERWNGRGRDRLRARMLEPLRGAYAGAGALYDRYELDGTARSRLEALPLYATAHALARVDDPELARRLREEKLEALWTKALAGTDTPYYLHNWLWFDAAMDAGATRTFDELLAFLIFDVDAFLASFPLAPFLACLALYPVARLSRGTRWRKPAAGAFVLAALGVCVPYLVWRARHSLNFIEPFGPVLSVSLWLAEVYCFGSVLLLLVQVGFGPARRRPAQADDVAATGDAVPSVDLLIPIFREPLEILERTLTAASAIRYPNKQIYVLDDGHRDAVRELARRFGAHCLPGPQRHAKAGNLNAALRHAQGELFAVFDTDHIPVASFLEETVPHFRDPKVGFVQTPHHFMNADIFQRALRVAGRVPNEQDLFNHAIQGGRGHWGGSFFAGSGALFRRAAIDAVGGFRLLSVTEDIHTSQHLHAAGWCSVFVDKDLAVGLSAENLASYIVQRRRWMQGCLQIFFRDNPLFCRGLPLRHRLGYFAALYHFFFPLARVVFWAAPLCYLLFHLHPILSDVAVLMALMLPYLVVLPSITRMLFPDWPRLLWGPFYECAVSAPLARSALDLLLPRALAFQVTPKGIVTQRRRFDWRSARWTLGVAAITAFAIAKGVYEYRHFGIERDAYFFNLAWAVYNLLFLLGALLLAWERPQRRIESRALRELPLRLELGDGVIEARTRELGLGGCSFELDAPRVLPAAFHVSLDAGGAVSLPARLVYQERFGRRCRVGLRFVDPPAEARRALLLGVFADTRTWEGAHAREVRRPLAAAGVFLTALLFFWRPLRLRRRHHPRRRRLALPRLLCAGVSRRVLLRDVSPRGLGLLCLGARPQSEGPWRLSGLYDSPCWGRVVYVRRRLPGLWWVGIERIEQPRELRAPECELAA